MTDTQIIDDLKTHIVSDLPDPSIAIEPDTNLFDSKIVDSLKILGLVVFVEERYGLSLNADDLTEENFQSLGALATLIGRKQKDV